MFDAQKKRDIFPKKSLFYFGQTTKKNFELSRFCGNVINFLSKIPKKTLKLMWFSKLPLNFSAFSNFPLTFSKKFENAQTTPPPSLFLSPFFGRGVGGWKGQKT